MTRIFSESPLDNCEPSDDFTFVNTRLKFTQGWWPQEAAGRWMKTKEATLKFVLPQKNFGQQSDKYLLRLRGDFFQGQPHSIFANIDGQRRQPFQTQEDGSFVTSFTTSSETDIITVVLSLSGKIAQSPKTLGLSNDERTLTYFLKSAELIPS